MGTATATPTMPRRPRRRRAAARAAAAPTEPLGRRRAGLTGQGRRAVARAGVHERGGRLGGAGEPEVRVDLVGAERLRQTVDVGGHEADARALGRAAVRALHVRERLEEAAAVMPAVGQAHDDAGRVGDVGQEALLDAGAQVGIAVLAGDRAHRADRRRKPRSPGPPRARRRSRPRARGRPHEPRRPPRRSGCRGGSRRRVRRRARPRRPGRRGGTGAGSHPSRGPPPDRSFGFARPSSRGPRRARRAARRLPRPGSPGRPDPRAAGTPRNPSSRGRGRARRSRRSRGRARGRGSSGGSPRSFAARRARPSWGTSRSPPPTGAGAPNRRPGGRGRPPGSGSRAGLPLRRPSDSGPGRSTCPRSRGRAPSSGSPRSRRW